MNWFGSVRLLVNSHHGKSSANMRLFGICLTLCLGLVGCIDFPTPPSPPIDSTASLEPAQQVAAALKGNIDRDPTQWPSLNEDYLLTSRDHSYIIPSLPAVTSQYGRDLSRLRAAAGISLAVPMQAVVDLQCAVPYGGGITGHNLITVDAKFFDVLKDYAAYLTLSEQGHTNEMRASALARITLLHNSFPCANLPLNRFIYASIPSTNSASTQAKYDSMAGAILYHEFGHHWTWALLDGLRINNAYWAFGVVPYYVYPAKSEDEADLIAGILTRKAGHNATLAMEMIDIMALYVFHRQYGTYPDISNIQSIQLQYARMNQQYSALAARKALIQAGYNAYR